MDPRYTREIERESADVLLDAGVSVPLFSLKFPFSKRRMTVRATMRRPTLAGQIRISRLYNRMGVTSEQMWDFDKEQQMKFLDEHGYEISRMIAVTLSRGRWAQRVWERPLAWIVRHWMPQDYMLGAMMRFVTLMGTDPFLPIIRSAERTNPMKPRLSQRREERQNAGGS